MEILESLQAMQKLLAQANRHMADREWIMADRYLPFLSEHMNETIAELSMIPNTAKTQDAENAVSTSGKVEIAKSTTD